MSFNFHSSQRLLKWKRRMCDQLPFSNCEKNTYLSNADFVSTFNNWLIKRKCDNYLWDLCTESSIFKEPNKLETKHLCRMRNAPPQKILDLFMLFLHNTVPFLDETRFLSTHLSKIYWYRFIATIRKLISNTRVYDIASIEEETFNYVFIFWE